MAGLLGAGRATAVRLERGGRSSAAPAPSAGARRHGQRAGPLLAQLALDAALRGDSHERSRALASRALARGALLDDDTAEGIVYYLAIAALIVAEDLQMAEAGARGGRERRPLARLGARARHRLALPELRDHAPRTRARRGGRGTRGSRGGAPRLAAGAAVRSRRAGRGARRVGRPGRGGGTGRARGRGRGRRTPPPAWPIARAAHSFTSSRGRPQEALADFIACGELLGAAGAPNPAVLSWRSGAARALAALGDRAEARRLAGEELDLAETFGAPGAIGRALRTLGSLEEGKQAIDLLEAAVASLESSQTALERARALVDLGSTLRRTHRSRDARDPLRRGLDLAQRCGAGELAKRAMREVTAAGARPRRSALHGFEALTPRELQTAGLAAEGKSNREIAAALFVTVKTVEWHLKHSYGKLGISLAPGARGSAGAPAGVGRRRS